MSDPAEMIVTLTVGQLEALVRRAVRDELARQKLEAPPLEPMLSTREASKILAVSPRQVQLLCESGDIPATKVGHQWRIRRADLAPRRGDRDAA